MSGFGFFGGHWVGMVVEAYQRANVYLSQEMTRDTLFGQRILILGSPGSGKSTFAGRLAHALNIPVVHLDHLRWKPNWTLEQEHVFQWSLEHALKGSRWIIDGNYSSTLSARLAYADSAIVLDVPRWLCLWRAVRRFVQYRGRSRPSMAQGCPERLNWGFLLWIWSHPKRQKETLAILHKHPHVHIVYLKPRDVSSFLGDVRIGNRKLQP